jgi:hypothetical protein
LADQVSFQTVVSTIASLIAIALSSATLGWTVYKDAIRRPRFRMSVAVKTVVQHGRPADGPHIFLEALNLGPIPNRIGAPFARKSWLTRRFIDREKSQCFIYPNFAHLAATPAATRVEVGDAATFVFPFTPECFLDDGFKQIGMTDGFGTIHWAPRRQLRKVQEAYRKAFPKVSQ